MYILWTNFNDAFRLRVERSLQILYYINAQLVNVCSGECYPADVAIADGLVVGVSAPGDGYQGLKERDLQGRWLAPGLIDGHMHIESTMLSAFRVCQNCHTAWSYQHYARPS